MGQLIIAATHIASDAANSIAEWLHQMRFEAIVARRWPSRSMQQITRCAPR
jgi:hypothetical protein